eukprot:4366230-Prymnesium_polylepis.1
MSHATGATGCPIESWRTARATGGGLATVLWSSLPPTLSACRQCRVDFLFCLGEMCEKKKKKNTVLG